jgi:ATPase subunit of ABC transporter with duplicated ATPase domains
MMASTRSTERRKIYIAVMGVTGAGKSTFIRTASGLEGVDVGHDLKSCERGWTNLFRVADTEEAPPTYFLTTSLTEMTR